MCLLRIKLPKGELITCNVGLKLYGRTASWGIVSFRVMFAIPNDHMSTANARVGNKLQYVYSLVSDYCPTMECQRHIWHRLGAGG